MKKMTNMRTKRTYKDTLFRMLFRDKENLLSLYNAVNGTDYTDTDGLEITTLENAVYMNYKNDISFVFHFELLLYEHQSTVNPNMPLRQLFYVSRVLQKRTRNENIYGSAFVYLPLPRFAVFYNGTAPQPEKQILRLSDSYEQKTKEPELELCVTVYNINLGCNTKLMEACKVLKEYAQYTEKVREYAEKMPFAEAVEAAVDYCIRNGILADFLLENKSEAIAVSIFEYDEEKHLKSEREYYYHVGREEGEKIGEQKGRLEGERAGEQKGRLEGERAGFILAFLEAGYPKETILGKLKERYALSQKESEICYEETVEQTMKV